MVSISNKVEDEKARTGFSIAHRLLPIALYSY